MWRAKPVKLAAAKKASKKATAPVLTLAPPVTASDLKHCPKCGKDLPLDDFASDKSNKKDGRYYMCRADEKILRDAKKAATTTAPAVSVAPAVKKATKKAAKK
ncbi:MAG: hypothetical protein ABI334_00490 [Candidatus Dormiibacterota bacterium]